MGSASPRSPPKPPSPRKNSLERVGEHRLIVGGVDGRRLEHDQRSLALVVDRADPAGRADRGLDGQRLVQRDGLLAVDHLGEVDVADVAQRRIRTTGAQDDRHGGECPLGDAAGVLGGELELGPGGVGGTGTHAERVQQAVLRSPRALVGLALAADDVEVDGHDGSFLPADADARWPHSSARAAGVVAELRS